jgi:hypothetical protein
MMPPTIILWPSERVYGEGTHTIRQTLLLC